MLDRAIWTESCKRFYYSDIQAIIIQETSASTVYTVLLAWFMAILGLIGLLLLGKLVDWGASWAILAFGGGELLLLAWLVGNWLLGPSCACFIRTAVQTERLCAVKRIRTARKVVATLRPLIEQAQAHLAVAPDQPVPARLHYAQPFPTELPLRPYDGRAHGILFLGLLLDAEICAIDLFFNHVAITLVGTTVTAALSILTIAALVKQHRSTLPHGLKGLTWGIAGYIGSSYIVSYFYTLYLTMERGGPVQDQWAMIKYLSSQDPFQSPFLFALLVCYGVVSLVLGGVGLLLLRSFRRGRGAAAPAGERQPK